MRSKPTTALTVIDPERSILDQLRRDIPPGSVGIPLTLRKSHNHPGPYQHLDQWEQIGTLDEIGRKPLSKDEDGQTWELFLMVKSRASGRQVKQALIDSFSYLGCEHQTWSWCNCLNYIGDQPTYLTGRAWKLNIHIFNAKQKRS